MSTADQSREPFKKNYKWLEKQSRLFLKIVFIFLFACLFAITEIKCLTFVDEIDRKEKEEYKAKHDAWFSECYKAGHNQFDCEYMYKH